MVGRLLTERKPSGITLRYQYDAAGNKTQFITEKVDGSQTIANYTYDALNRLATVSDTQGNTTTYGYDAVGNRQTITHANGTQASYQYDALNRLTQLQHQTDTGVVLDSFSYQLNNTGQRTRITDADNTVSNYQYDAIHRLESEEVIDSSNTVTHTANYQYDKTGNRIQGIVNGITTAYTYDDNDRLTQQGGENYTYDANGSTLQMTIDDKVTDYQYNALNQLSQVQKSEAGTITDTSSYQYDSDGNRSKAVENGSETRFIVDNNQAYAQVVQEQDNTGQTQVSYLYGDDLLQQRRGTDISHYHYDGLGSTRLLTDDTGNITDRYRYEAFGEAIEELGNTTNRYKFTGEQYDSNLAFYYLRARYYNPHQGRFTQQDTWMGNSSDPITLHKYLYANTNPVNNIDPTGNAAILAQMNTLSSSVLTSMFSISLTGARVVGRTFIAAATYSLAGVKHEVKRCYKSKGKKCRIPNIVFIGSDYPESQKHIYDAQIGFGSNEFPISPVVTYLKGGHKISRQWYKNNPVCKAKTEGQNCDEWPWFASVEGGRARYNSGRVSLRAIFISYSSF